MVTSAELVATPRATSVSQVTEVERARAVAEVLAAVQVAQTCPRDMERAYREMETACARLKLAERAFYSVPNRGTGPSVHLARDLARIWGNIDYGVRELRRDDEHGVSEVQAFAWDQQTNARSTRSFIVPHARMKKVNGKQTRETLVDLNDIYLNNQNIGARAVRECIYAILPGDFVAEAEDLCRGTLERGDGKSLDQRVNAMVAAYASIGVTVQQIEAKVGRTRREFGPQDVASLGVTYRSIKSSETTIADEFPAAPIKAADLVGPSMPIASTPAVNPAGTFRPAGPGETPGQVEPDDAPATDPQAELVVHLDDTTAPAAISGGQRARLSELLAATNRRGQSAARRYIKDTIGREVASPADLTADEAELVIGQLDAETDANQPQAGEPA